MARTRRRTGKALSVNILLSLRDASDTARHAARSDALRGAHRVPSDGVGISCRNYVPPRRLSREIASASPRQWVSLPTRAGQDGDGPPTRARRNPRASATHRSLIARPRDHLASPGRDALASTFHFHYPAPPSARSYVVS